jgi:DNA (cytosine-5)-methyltransferase 1
VGNTKKLSHLGLCSGYGGIERGIELTGTKLRTLAHVEIEAFAVANLVSKMEKGELAPCPIWTDLKTLPLAPFRGAVDLLTGGYPCQPFSLAGKRLGAEDPRHLWPYILKIIDGIMPRMCFFENVEGHVNNGLQQVLADLEARGYSCSWGIFSASEVGAPHQRKRVFILADSISGRMCRGRSGEECGNDSKRIQNNEGERDEFRGEVEGFSSFDSGAMAHAHGAGLDRDGLPSRPKQTFPMPPGENQYDWESPRTIAKPQVGGAIDGSSNRVDQLRLLGNGVVPQTAALAWQTLNCHLTILGPVVECPYLKRRN